METKKCNTLEEVRVEIDALDDQIIEIIAARNEYISQVAKFKDTVDDVKAPERVDFILNKVRHKAGKLGVSPNMLSEIYKIMIDEMVETEIAEFRNNKTF